MSAQPRGVANRHIQHHLLRSTQVIREKKRAVGKLCPPRPAKPAHVPELRSGEPGSTAPSSYFVVPTGIMACSYGVPAHIMYGFVGSGSLALVYPSDLEGGPNTMI